MEVESPTGQRKEKEKRKKSQKDQAKRKSRLTLEKFSRLTPNPPKTRQTRSKGPEGQQ